MMSNAVADAERNHAQWPWTRIAHLHTVFAL